MNNHPLPACRYDFYFPDVDTLIRVESTPQSVIIRASRNTFTERRKQSFIHELAAEGFIPDDYEWLSLAGSEISRGARWVIDFSWLRISAASRGLADRFMRRLLGVGFASWIVQMAFLWLHHAG
jgi:hypothetical protein